MSNDAYRTIAESLIAHAPGPFERIEAQFRVYDTMFESQIVAIDREGKAVGFSVRGPDSERLKQAVRGLRETLPHGSAPPFTRADFHLERGGRFRFDAYYAPQLLDRLAQVLRARWPDKVARLRLVARYVAGEERGWELEYYDVGNGHPRALPRPRSTLDLDTPLWLISDLSRSIPDRAWQRFEIELGREGPYEVRVDGEPFTAQS